MELFYGLFTNPASFPVWGIAGTVLVLAGCIIPSFRYQGRLKQRYSPLNHFISELGERKVSEYAAVFNIGLIVAGLLYTMFMIQFGAFIGSTVSIIAAAVGIFTSLSCCMVGVFPMDTMKKHDNAAMCFFYGGLTTILLFGLSSLYDKQNRLPVLFILFAAVVVLSFAAFILLPYLLPKPEGHPDYFGADRPRIWLVPLVEWIAMLSVVGWIAAVSFYFV